MSTELSLRAAAHERPDDCALIAGGQSYSFKQLAEKSAALALPARNIHRAQSALQSALLLYRSLEETRPLCLLSATMGDEEQKGCARRVPADLPPEVALVLFTSGSSGQAKGVKLSRRALLASARASALSLGWFGQDRWLCALPLSHIGGLSILVRCLVARKTAYLCEGFHTAEVAAAISDEGISHVSLVPTMLWRLLESGFQAPSHLRVTLIGGAAVQTSLIDRARAAGFRLQLSYGMTETASQIISDGYALEGVMLRVQDDRLEIKAPTLMDGYLPPHSPERVGSGAWFRTDDRASINDEGRVQILGRADDMIISGGENIDPRAVEAALNESPLVRESFALSLEHEEWGQELVALVVPSGTRFDPQELELPGLQGHRKPKALLLVAALPLLETGKIDHQQARAIARHMRARLRD